MDEMNLDWSDLNLFLAVARGGGLAAGAKISGQSAPTLSRHMNDLEHALGVVLFNRLPQGYELTEEGRTLLTQSEAVEERIAEIKRARSEGTNTLPIRISAGSWMTWFLTRNIDKLKVDNAVMVFSATEIRHNIGRRETIIGIRNQRPTENGIAARRTTRVDFAPFATSEASQHTNWIATTATTPSAAWVRLHKRDFISIEVTHPRSLLDLALVGAGHVVLPCFVGDAHDELVRAGPVIEELSHDQWLVVHGEERIQPSVRQTVDLIADLISKARQQFKSP